MAVKYSKTRKVVAPLLVTGAVFFGAKEAKSIERPAQPSQPAVTGIKSLENLSLRHRIPRLPKSVTRLQAKQLAKQRGLTVKGDRPDCKPDAQNYCQTDGFAKRQTVSKNIGGHIVKKTIYKKLKPGTKVVPKTPLFLTHHRTERPYLTSAQLQAKAKEFLINNAVYIEILGCSGTLVRDQSGKPIGVSTAQHCGMGPNVASRQTDSTGGKFIDLPDAVTVALGVNHEKTVGVATSAFLPIEGLNADGALLVLGDNRPQDVIDNYDNQQIAPSFTGLGETVYSASYPSAQPKNSGTARLQFMDMKGLGLFTINTSLGQTLDTQAFGMNQNTDASVCSFGASGSSYVSIKETPTHKLDIRVGGVLSGYDDFRSPDSNTVGYDGRVVEIERTNDMGRSDIIGLYDAFCYYTRINPILGVNYEQVALR